MTHTRVPWSTGGQGIHVVGEHDELEDHGVYYEVASQDADHAARPSVAGRPARHDRMDFCVRKRIRPEDLDANGTLVGGRLLTWIDEEATIYTIVQLGNPRVVTKFMSEIDFVSAAQQGDLVEVGLRATAFGRTSITLQVGVRNMISGASILTIDTIVLVGLDDRGRPTPHGCTEITDDRDRWAGADARVHPVGPGAATRRDPSVGAD